MDKVASVSLSYLDRAPSRIVETVEVKDLIRRISRPELRVSTLKGASPADKNVFVSKFSYICPEPVLVNLRFWYKMASFERRVSAPRHVGVVRGPPQTAPNHRRRSLSNTILFVSDFRCPEPVLTKHRVSSNRIRFSN
jgi:hypothetical protein